MAVYSGDNVGGLTAIAATDAPIANLVSFFALAGTTYFIVADGKIFRDINRDAPPMGRIVLSWHPTVPLSIRALDKAQVEIAWPASASAFVLQFAIRLEPMPNWTTVDATPMAAGTLLTITSDASAGSKFFRLIKP